VSLITSAVFAALLILTTLRGVFHPGFALTLANVILVVLLLVFAVLAAALVVYGGVLVTAGVAMECLETNGHIPDSGGEAKERVSALRRVLVSIASVRWWVHRSRCG